MLAAIDLDAANPVTGGNAAPMAWVSGERDRVGGTTEMRKAAKDPARRIGVAHNHPDSVALSSTDLKQLEEDPGLARRRRT